jgi:branched-chain amino acid transport system substrate-binding protein
MGRRKLLGLAGGLVILIGIILIRVYFPAVLSLTTAITGIVILLIALLINQLWLTRASFDTDPTQKVQTIHEKTPQEGAPATKDRVDSVQEDQRILDAAISPYVIVDIPTELLVMIRQTASAGLARVIADGTEYPQIKSEDIRAKNVTVEFPIGADGEPDPAEWIVRLDSPDFEPKQQHKRILIPPDGDSEIYSFLLRPLRVGQLLINLELYRGGTSLFSKTLRTTCQDSGIPEKPKYVLSIPIEAVPLPGNLIFRITNTLDQAFDLAEFKDILLSIDFPEDQIGLGPNQRAIVSDAVTYCFRSGRILPLLTTCQARRPVEKEGWESLIGEVHDWNSRAREQKDRPIIIDLKQGSQMTGADILPPIHPPGGTELPNARKVNESTSRTAYSVIGMVALVLVLFAFSATYVITQISPFPPAAVGGDIRLAVLVPLSGPISATGISARNGALLAIDEWNARGGVLGKKIVPIVVDSQCQPDAAVNAANQVMDQDKVHYIIGEVCSKASIPISEIANQKKVIQISPTSTNAALTMDKNGAVRPYTFRIAFTDSFQGAVMAKFARNKGYRTAYVIDSPQSDSSGSVAQSFMAAFEENGGAIVGQEQLAGDQNDFSALLTRVAASQAEALFIPETAPLTNRIGARAKEIKLKAVLLGGDVWDSPDLDFKAVEGGFFPSQFSSSDPRPLTQNFLKSYGKAFKDGNGNPAIPDSVAALSYDAANLMLKAIAKAGANEPERVKTILANLNAEGVTGRISFDLFHNPIKSASIIGIKDGKASYVITIEP